MSDNALAIARACLQAYVDKDRGAIEALLDDDFHFTSPIDNALDRTTYMQVCWPNSTAIVRFDIEEYRGESLSGPHSCRTYRLTHPSA